MKLSLLLISLTINTLLNNTVLANEYSTNGLTETNNLVVAQGKSVTLLGTQVNEGEKAPDFKVVN